MNLIFAHSAGTGKWMFLAGAVLAAVFVWWLAAVAARRNVLWVLAVFLLPITALILIFVDSKAVRPALLYLCSLGMAFWGFEGIDGRDRLSLEDRAELFATEIVGNAPLARTPGAK